MKKQKAIFNNYVHLQDKSVLPIGGISHSDLMDVARYTATYIPAGSLKATVTATGVGAGVKINEVSYSLTQIVAENCLANVSGGIPCYSGEGHSYQNTIFSEIFRS